jgi:glutathione synthase/RimK-type ligase-like ATP-grasp enzyme
VLLIVTERGDFHADWLVLELEARRAPFLRFNTEDYPQRTMVVWRNTGEASLRVAGREHSLSDFDAVWYRRPLPPQMPADMPAAAAAWARNEAREALLGVWRTTDALWVNHPDRNRVAESKLAQLRVAGELGFEVPDTLVSNDQEVVRAFLAAHPEGVICKPLYDGRVPVGDDERVFFTSLVEAESVPLGELGPEPYLFQSLVPKLYDIRATVIGDEVFAARIDSQTGEDTQTDWRRGRPGVLPHAVVELPDGLAELCVALCRRFGLMFGAIDLARRPDGGHSFFEINPNGQWAWVEHRTGLPLRARLADLLLGAGEMP